MAITYSFRPAIIPTKFHMRLSSVCKSRHLIYRLFIYTPHKIEWKVRYCLHDTCQHQFPLHRRRTGNNLSSIFFKNCYPQDQLPFPRRNYILTSMKLHQVLEQNCDYQPNFHNYLVQENNHRSCFIKMLLQ